jgi:protein-disulfide isomerase
MSSRSESKQAAREARIAAEQEAASKARRQRIWALVGGSALLAAIVVVILIVISSGGSGGDGGSKGDVAIFDGIPQKGIELGDPKAPVTVVEFADPQCPFCRQYTTDVMPGLIEKYVKTGDVRMELNLLTFIGADSETAAEAAYAAAAQDRMWQFMDVFYARQQQENSGYVTQDFIDGVAEAAGVDVDRMTSDMGSQEVADQIAEAKSAAADAGVASTPTFQVGPTGGSLSTVADSGKLADAIDQQLAAAK